MTITRELINEMVEKYNQTFINLAKGADAKAFIVTFDKENNIINSYWCKDDFADISGKVEKIKHEVNGDLNQIIIIDSNNKFWQMG